MTNNITQKVKVGGEIKEIPIYKFNDGARSGGFKNDSNYYYLRPDAGWETNIGKSAWGIDVQAWNKVKDMPEKIKYDFLSKMASNPHKEKSFINFIDNALIDISKPKGNKEIAAWVGSDTFEILQKSSINLKTPLITMQDSRVSHLIGDRKNLAQKLSKEQLYNLYNVINSPNSIYLDTQDNSLIFIHFLPKNEIIDNRNCIKVVIKLDKLHKGLNLNYVATAGRVNFKDFSNNKIYKKIE